MNQNAIKKAAEELAKVAEASKGITPLRAGIFDFARALAAAMEEESVADSEAVMLLRRHKHMYPIATNAWAKDRDALLARIDAEGGGA